MHWDNKKRVRAKGEIELQIPAFDKTGQTNQDKATFDNTRQTNFDKTGQPSRRLRATFDITRQANLDKRRDILRQD